MASSVSTLHSPLSCKLGRSLPTSSSHSRSPSCALFSPSLRPGRGVSSLRSRWKKPFLERRSVVARAVAEEETLASEDGETVEAAQEAASEADQPVSVPVSPSDMLTMFFKILELEGTDRGLRSSEGGPEEVMEEPSSTFKAPFWELE